MQYGLVIFPTIYTPTPAELAVAAELRGFESLWFPEHTHIPAGREPGSVEVTVFYALPDADLIKRYRDAGVKRCIFGLPAMGAQQVMPMMDQFAEFVQAQG